MTTVLTHAADPAAEVEHDLPDVVVPVAMAWSVAAGVIHLLVAPAHLREAWWLGAGFVAVGLAQLALVALLMRPQPVWVLLVATWGYAAAAGFYVATRTVDVWFMPAHGRGHEVGHLPVLNGVGTGIPVYPGDRIESVGPLDLTCLLAEIVVVAMLLTMLPATVRARTTTALAALAALGAVAAQLA